MPTSTAQQRPPAFWNISGVTAETGGGTAPFSTVGGAHGLPPGTQGHTERSGNATGVRPFVTAPVTDSDTTSDPFPSSPRGPSAGCPEPGVLSAGWADLTAAGPRSGRPGPVTQDQRTRWPTPPAASGLSYILKNLRLWVKLVIREEARDHEVSCPWSRLRRLIHIQPRSPWCQERLGQTLLPTPVAGIGLRPLRIRSWRGERLGEKGGSCCYTCVSFLSCFQTSGRVFTGGVLLNNRAAAL